MPIDERFERLLRMVGRENLEKLNRAFVVVVGVGAVGSFAVEALARSGVGQIRIVDNDVVQLSNINRQLIALENTLGRRKIEVARERILQINPHCHVDTLDLRVDNQTAAQTLDGNPQVVLDAIDLAEGKAALIAESVQRGIPIVCSMGAARRRDPMGIRTGTFADITGCPLARSVRQRLRVLGVAEQAKKMDCVYSVEEVVPIPISEDTTPHVHGQRIPLPSLITVTGCFGLNLANLAMRRIL